MYYFCLLIFMSLFYSCLRNKKDATDTQVLKDTLIINNAVIDNTIEENKNIDSISNLILKNGKISGDTLKYKFYIEDVGTEGNEGTAYFIDKKIIKLDFVIYTSMWEIQLKYLFDNNKINIIEKTYNIYEKTTLQKTISYTVDFQGNPLQNVDESRVDVFQEIKDNIPFELK